MTRNELINFLSLQPDAEVFVDSGRTVYDITHAELQEDGVKVIVLHIKEA
jgi:hypothetical protein